MDNLTEKSKPSLKTTELSPLNWDKVAKDLRFIDLITQNAGASGYRVVISGGYAVDGNLGVITRPHNDIDIEVYGTEGDPWIIRDLVDRISQQKDYSGLKLKDKGRQEFYHAFFAKGSGFGADIYYVQTVGNPFAERKVVVKKDGSRTPEHPFNTRRVVLERTIFEVVNPKEQLEDILKKAEKTGVVRPEHKQDVENLRALTS